MLTKANAVGYAVLAFVIDRMTDEQVREIRVEPYLNGRESGFAIQFWGRYSSVNQLWDRKLAFSEYRRSDEIVVYEGKPHEFGMNGNSLSDSIYANQRRFPVNQVVQAADYIYERLTEFQYTS